MIASQVEVLVHAARRVSSVGTVTSESIEDMRDSMQANAYFPVMLTRLLLPNILQRMKLGRLENTSSPSHSSASSTSSGSAGGGRVLFITSLCPTIPAPRTSVLAASQAFVASFAQVNVPLRFTVRFLASY